MIALATIHTDSSGFVLARCETCGHNFRWRMREMRRIYRTRMAELGMVSGMERLEVVVSNPEAIVLLEAAV